MAVVTGTGLVMAALQIRQASKLAKLQHTITFLNDERRRRYHEDVADLLEARFQFELSSYLHPLPDNVVEFVFQDKAARRAVLEMLNYYEVIAVAISAEAADKDIVSQTCGSTIRRLWLNWEPYVSRRRTVMKNDLVLCDLEMLAKDLDAEERIKHPILRNPVPGPEVIALPRNSGPVNSLVPGAADGNGLFGASSAPSAGRGRRSSSVRPPKSP